MICPGMLHWPWALRSIVIFLSISSGASLGDVINLTGAESLGKNNFYSVP